MHYLLRPIRLIAISSVVVGVATAAIAATTAAPPMLNGVAGEVLLAQAAQPKAQPKAQPRMNTAVYAAQLELRIRGYDTGAADGQLGPKTAAALRAFQTREKIPVNGALDARTIAALGIRP